jgi:hypothetical protein
MKLIAGQPFEPSARQFNRYEEAADLLLGSATDGTSRRGPRRWFGLLVKNMGGEAMETGCPVKIGTLRTTGVAGPQMGLLGGEIYEGTFSDGCMLLPTCGVAIDTIPDGKVGWVATGGFAWVKVDGTEVGACVDTLPITATYFRQKWRYSSSGPHRVRARVSGGAIVELGAGCLNVMCRTPAGGIAAQGAGVPYANCLIDRVNPTTGEITTTTFVCRVHNMLTTAIPGDRRVQAKPIGDRLFVDVGSC